MAREITYNGHILVLDDATGTVTMANGKTMSTGASEKIFAAHPAPGPEERQQTLAEGLSAMIESSKRPVISFQKLYSMGSNRGDAWDGRHPLYNTGVADMSTDPDFAKYHDEIRNAASMPVGFALFDKIASDKTIPYAKQQAARNVYNYLLADAQHTVNVNAKHNLNKNMVEVVRPWSPLDWNREGEMKVKSVYKPAKDTPQYSGGKAEKLIRDKERLEAAQKSSESLNR